VLEATLGLMPGYVAFMALLVPVGFAAVTVTTTANALTQLHVDPPLRGRVLSVYFLVLLGGTPIGAPLVGVVSDALGARCTLMLGGAISALSALALLAWGAGRQRLNQRKSATGTAEADACAADARTTLAATSGEASLIPSRSRSRRSTPRPG
jgi:MFS family permease